MPLTLEQQRKRDEEYLARPDPERIFLGPKCEALTDDGRLWSMDAHDCEEPECGMKSVEYIRLDIAIAGGYREKKD